ncbi:hypothetical protein SCA6_014625 [Theobroma cacao]
MAIREDIEKGNDSVHEEASVPLLQEQKTMADEEDGHTDQTSSKASLWMVYLSTFVAVCGSFEFGSCAGYSSPTQTAIREDLSLTLAEYSVFGSILTLGAMIGAITSGPIADFIGRKGAMRTATGFCVAGWLAIYFAKGALPLDIGRLATGYGMGVFSYVVPVFIAEIAPKNLRGALTTINQLMICTGVSVAFIIGTVLTWRTLALTGLIPCAILLCGLFFIPESPRWLVVITGLNATVIDKAGRKPLLLVSSAGLVLGCMLSGISFYLKGHNLALNSVPILAVAGILIYIGSFSAGMGAVPWVVMSEVHSFFML